MSRIISSLNNDIQTGDKVKKNLEVAVDVAIYVQTCACDFRTFCDVSITRRSSTFKTVKQGRNLANVSWKFFDILILFILILWMILLFAFCRKWQPYYIFIDPKNLFINVCESWLVLVKHFRFLITQFFA